MSDSELTAQFLHPGPQWRGKPFWSWNGVLRQDELIRQVHVLKDMGMGGFFMHSRTGLVTEYLGDEWFRLTNACAEEAARLGLEAWLYDEDRWPSGTAGGLVTQDPAFRLKFLSLRPMPASEFVWQDDLLAAFTCHLDGLDFRECRPLDRNTPPADDMGLTVLAFTVEEMEPSSFYNGFTYVDTMKREATDRYISVTHAQYLAHCGSHFGTSIQGIFTDEPHRGAVMSGFGISNPNRLWMTPWTEALPEEYARRFGQDFTAHLPELFLRPEGRAVSPVKWRYMELLQQLFLENFAKPLYDWCSQNALRLTGHALHEDSLTCQAAMQGSLMRCYEFLHDPGVDVLTEGNRNYVIVKQLSSAARQLGRTRLLSELYGCTGWQMSFQSHKEVGDWQALLGINVRCHHLTWYTMEGEAKRDYPASIGPQSAWWNRYDFVETYFARLGLLLSQGEPCRDILVVNPVESVWCQIHAGWAEGLSPTGAAVQALERDYAALASWLLGGQVDFDFGDEEMLGRLSSVKDDAGVPVLWVGQASYRAVVVGQMTTLRVSTLCLLEAFAAQGGTVIFAGPPPAFVDALPSDAPARLAAQVVETAWDQNAVLAACRRATQFAVEVRDAGTGAGLPDLFCQLRADGEAFLFAVLNVNPQRGYEDVTLRVPLPGASWQVEEWDCRTGERFGVDSRTEDNRTEDGWTEWTASFAPSGERVFRVTPLEARKLAPRPVFSPSGQISCTQPFAYTLGEPNVCVLDFARFQLGSGAWSERLEILAVDGAVRTAFNLPLRGGEMVQPWFRRSHPAPPVQTRLTLAFDFEIDILPDDLVLLALERPEMWAVTLNGQPVSEAPNGWWVDRAFQTVPLPPGLLHIGGNTLTLDTEFHEGVNLEAVFLLGGFGVRLDGSRASLTRLPAALTIGDLTRQGLPFYGGPLTCHLPAPLPAEAGPRLRVTVPEFEAACVSVLGPDASPQPVSFAPYEIDFDRAALAGDCLSLEVVLTRRNTFGPLHQIPLRCAAYGPGNFVTAGAEFTENYQLYPAGLLKAPGIAWS